MATTQGTADFILEQIAGAGAVSARKMFGDYGVYCDGKVVAFLCDDQLFVKATEAGRAFIGEVVEAPPYPGGKPGFLIDGAVWDDADWLSGLIAVTASALPVPKPKAKSGKP